MLNQTLIYSLYNIGCVQFGEFKLKSGQISPIYINLRKIISYPDILRTIARAMWDKTLSAPFDLVCGVPYTALPIATCISLGHEVPMVMRRKEKKEYGTKQLIEGDFEPGQRCLVIEDVVTTGGSLLETVKDLEEAGLIVEDVVALIDREQGAPALFAPKYHLHTIFSLSDLFSVLLNSSTLPQREAEAIQRYLKDR